MQFLQILLWIFGGLVALILIGRQPQRLKRWLVLLGFNAFCGLGLIIALNFIIGYPVLFIPINGLTIAVCSFLGLPGAAALAVLVAI